MMRHLHDFTEVLSVDDGLTRRCQCGARLWEPSNIVLEFSEGVVVKRNGRLVFVRTAAGMEAVK